jgi:hypothetical protein
MISQQRIEACRKIAAELALADPAFGPVFLRLDDEVKGAIEMAESDDPVWMARAVLARQED